MNTIKISGFKWTAYGKIEYDYKSKKDNTLWNVEKIENDTVFIYTVNAWGRVYEENYPLEIFKENFNLRNGR